jgi:hypothetical protein
VQETRAKTRDAAPKKKVYHRGEEDNEQAEELVSERPFVPSYKFNFLREFYFEGSPQAILSILEHYRDEVNQNLNLTLDTDKKRIIIEDSKQSLKLKLKLYKVN